MKVRTLYLLILSIISTVIISFFLISSLRDNSIRTPVGMKIDANVPRFIQEYYGAMDKQLDKPMDVVVVDDKVFVTDTNNFRVQVFDKNGSPLSSFGSKGTGKGQFSFPYGITADESGRIYVGDMKNGNISIFNQDGRFLRYFQEKEDGEVTYPGGLRIIGKNLYVSDISDGAVFVFSLDGTKKLEIREVSGSQDLLSAPNAVVADKHGNIYVSDSGNQRVVVYNSAGQFKKIINGAENADDSSIFVNPRGIGISEGGQIYVVDQMAHMVFGFSSKGEKVVQFGGIGSGEGQLYFPNGFFIGQDGRFYVTDTSNRRVEVFEP